MSAAGDAPAATRRRLPLHRILMGAFALPWRHRAEVARVVGLPLLAVIACTLTFNLGNLADSPVAHWTLFFFYLIATGWLALSVHRLVLIEDGDPHARLDRDGLKRLARFVGMIIIVWLVYAAVMLLVQLGAAVAFGKYSSAGQPLSRTAFPSMWIQWIGWVLALWPAARVCLVLPATAVDRSSDPRSAWSLSRGNGWKLAVIIGVLPWALKWLAYLFYRDNASLLEFGIMLVLVASLTVFQVVALSLSYWELTQPEPPPIDPPA